MTLCSTSRCAARPRPSRAIATASKPRQRDTLGVERLGYRARCLQRSLLVAVQSCGPSVAKRILGESHRRRVIAHTKRQAAAFLQQVSPLDGRIGPFEQGRRIGIARLRSGSLPLVPQQPPQLAQYPRGGRAVLGGAMGGEHGLVVLARGIAPAGRSAQIGNALAKGKLFPLLSGAGGQRGERLLVELKRIVVGVDCASPIPGRRKITRPFRLLRAEAEMMAQRHQILQEIGIAAPQALQGGADQSVHLGAPLQEKVLVDHILQQSLREAIALR